MEILQQRFHAATQSFAQLFLRYTREQTEANWHAVEEAQFLLYQVQVYMLEGNTDKALALLPHSPCPYQ